MRASLKADIEKLFAVYTEIEGPAVKRPLTSEIKRFVGYILASNGKISDGEAEFMGDVLDRQITSEELANYVTAENVYSWEFAETIPPVFKRNIHNGEASKCYLEACLAVGKDAIVSDKQAEQAEVDVLTSYINRLLDFFKEENGIESDPIEEVSSADFEGKIVDGTPEGAATLEELLAELDGLIGLQSGKRNAAFAEHPDGAGGKGPAQNTPRRSCWISCNTWPRKTVLQFPNRHWTLPMSFLRRSTIPEQRTLPTLGRCGTFSNPPLSARQTDCMEKRILRMKSCADWKWMTLSIMN